MNIPSGKNISLSVRIFFVYFIFVSLGSYFILNSVLDQIKPAVRQATEETLVDTANLLAEFLREPMLKGQVSDPQYAQLLASYGQRKLHAKIWGIDKTKVAHRIYVTNVEGKVLLDSLHQAEGQDYSHWNDVYLTLQGKYGARSTLEDKTDDGSSVMYIGAPIVDGDKIIGMVSVGKPNRSVQPFIDRSKLHLLWVGSVVVAVGLLAGILFSWWLLAELRRLRNYANSVALGERAILPPSKIASGELNHLASALESMRLQLDGKAYVETYVQNLTHELKSPLAGIRAAAELLQTPMEELDRQKFEKNIESETLRMQHMIDQLLNLSRIEQQQVLQDVELIDLNLLWSELFQSQMARALQRGITLENNIPEGVLVRGERLLLRQAFENIFENALDFTSNAGRISVATEKNEWEISVILQNQGDLIPDFALARITEKFFSLPRPRTGKKSTGLGLSFVKEVAELHGAQLNIHNLTNGVEVRFTLAA